MINTISILVTQPPFELTAGGVVLSPGSWGSMRVRGGFDGQVSVKGGYEGTIICVGGYAGEVHVR